MKLLSVSCAYFLTAADKKRAFNEATGRVVGWWSLLFNKPQHR